MKKRDLLAKIKSIPDDAEIYVMSDHGQQSEKGSHVSYSYNVGKLPFYGEDLEWHDNYKEGMTCTAIMVS